MTLDERLKEIEFENLYKEIAEHAGKVNTIIHWCIAGAFSFLGVIFAFDPSKLHVLKLSEFSPPFLFLLPLVFILPSIQLVASHLNSTARIATFIKVFYEEDHKVLKWQTNIQRQRELKNRYLGGALRSLLPLLGVIFFLFSVVSAVDIVLPLLFDIKSKCSNSLNDVPGIFWGVVLLIIYVFVIWIGLSMSQKLNKVWDTENFKKYIEEWDKIKRTS